MRWDEGAMGAWAQMLGQLQQPFASPFAPLNLAGGQGTRLYEAQMRMLGETLQRFAGGFVERQQRSPDPIGMRELYDLWIDCAEAAYAGLARDPAFVAAQAAAVNAAYVAFGEQRPGAPTSAEFEALRQRIATLEGQLQERREPEVERKRDCAREAQPTRKAQRPRKAQPARKAQPSRKAPPTSKARPK